MAGQREKKKRADKLRGLKGSRIEACGRIKTKQRIDAGMLSGGNKREPMTRDVFGV